VRRGACAVALALALAPAAAVAAGPAISAATETPATASTSAATGTAAVTTTGSVEKPFTPATGASRLTGRTALERFLGYPKVAHWLQRYPAKPQTEATFDASTRVWTVKVWSGRAGEIALGKVQDSDGRVLEAFTGPQVAWSMARGRVGSFGGKVLNAWWTWIPLSLAFFVGLVDRRRLRSWHTLDLLALVSFGFSLWAFNVGHIFLSASLGALPLAYLLVRTCWIGFRGRAFNPALSWPVWLLAAVAVFIGGLRIGLNLENPRGVIDVGYAGVIGGDRILDGVSPYGHMPVENTSRSCGPADSGGEIREWIQSNGRCEAANPRGDTYGPVAYIVYSPFVLTLLWSGKWDSLPAAHATAIAFDLLVVLGLFLVGRRFGGLGLGVALAFGWLSLPFTAYALNSNSNDAIMPAFLVWGFWLCTSPVARGAAVALSGWTKFATLLLAPLWLTYPNGLRPRTALRFLAGFVGATLAAFSILLLEPSLIEAIRTFVERTIDYQIGRDSPFSPWDWKQYHAAGIPDLSALQLVVQVAVVALAGVVAVIPRRKGPLELAALTAGVLVGFELTLTHWSYLYIPWFLPFVLLALLLPRRLPEPAPVPAAPEVPAPSLSATAEPGPS
jgi:hypothetical protein